MIVFSNIKLCTWSEACHDVVWYWQISNKDIDNQVISNILPYFYSYNWLKFSVDILILYSTYAK